MGAGAAAAALAALATGGLLGGAAGSKCNDVNYPALRRMQSSALGLELGKHDDGSEAEMPAMHPGLVRMEAEQSYRLMHPIYKTEDLEIKPAHREPNGVRDSLALGAVRFARGTFDVVTGYNSKGHNSESHWLRRVLFLETVAGVPGMVAAMLRHMASLRNMEPDNGWIHTLLEEAENERMHLLTFIDVQKASWALRGLILLAQGVFFNAYLLAYLVSPTTCHRFIGYLEEEAVRTYTHLLEDLDTNPDLAHWSKSRAPAVAIDYWRLPDNATLRDVVAVVRADEACHSHVNHTFAAIPREAPNPFGVGDHDFDKDDFTKERTTGGA